MNSNVMPSRVRMEPNLLEQLVAEVKETIATGVHAQPLAPASSFKAIDFWKVRRNGRFVHGGNTRKKNASLSVTHVSF